MSETRRGSDVFAAVPRSGPSRRELLALAGLGITGLPGLALAAAPQGQLTWGVHVSLAPTWFDPAETSGIITPYMMLYALHDAMAKPMPDNPLAPSLAESWEASKDGLHYDFVLRDGVHFHNGDTVTADDVKFSFERYRGASHEVFKNRVAAVETPDARHVRFTLKEAWPDFLTFYASATGAGWIVPKKYLEKVGDDGFKKHPIGAGPYKFVSFNPGVELTLEAFDGFWRKTPAVKRLVMRSIPDASTRLAALKGGDVDIVYWISGELAEEVQRDQALTLKPALVQTNWWVYFTGQFDPSSPWHDIRVRHATSLAIDRKTINKVITFGYSKLTGNAFVPNSFEYYWEPPAEPEYDIGRAKQLLADAGHPNGIDVGPYYCDAAFSGVGEAVVNSLREAGIRANLRPVERAAFYKGYSEKTFKGLIQGGTAAFGNAATRLGQFAVKGGTYAYGSYPEIDELYQQQAAELDTERRAELLHKAQRLVQEKIVAAPIWQLAALAAVGPRVGESTFGLIAGYPWTSPYEDLTVKAT
jgi:peptide/nickel transport system substrate-binding protein